MYKIWGIWNVRKCPLVGNGCKIDGYCLELNTLFHYVFCSCITCKVPDMHKILHTLSEQIETPFITIAGVMSFSDNLAEFKPAWVGGRGILPAGFAVDDNIETCTTVPHEQAMVVDLGFNANTTLHVKITVKGVYLIHIYVPLLWECACGYMCICVSNSAFEMYSITDNLLLLSNRIFYDISISYCCSFSQNGKIVFSVDPLPSSQIYVTFVTNGLPDPGDPGETCKVMGGHFECNACTVFIGNAACDICKCCQVHTINVTIYVHECESLCFWFGCIINLCFDVPWRILWSISLLFTFSSQHFPTCQNRCWD